MGDDSVHMTAAPTLGRLRTVDLRPKPPFHFDSTMHKPDHFPSRDNHWEPGVRWQTMLWQGEPLGLRFENAGEVDEPCIRLSVWSQEALSERYWRALLQEIEYRYGLELDLAGFYHRFAGDLQLGPVIARWRGLRPLNCNSLYEYLVIAIVLQNTIVRRSVSMMQALFERYGRLVSFDGRQLYSFWAPEAIQQTSEQDLRDLKLGYRAKSLKRVTEAFATGQIDESSLRGRPLDEQRQALLALYGIGPASVGYILFDVFHHLDELSHISLWEQRIYSRLFFDASPDQPVEVEKLLDHFQQRYGGYRMLAVHYFWEDLFWRRKHEPIDWLEKLIRL